MGLAIDERDTPIAILVGFHLRCGGALSSPETEKHQSRIQIEKRPGSWHVFDSNSGNCGTLPDQSILACDYLLSDLHYRIFPHFPEC